MTRTHARTHTHTQYSREDFSGRDNGASQRSLADYTQHSQVTGIYVPGGIRTRNPTSERPQTYTSDRPDGGIGNFLIYTGEKVSVMRFSRDPQWHV
jgi:hypothetical protein